MRIERTDVTHSWVPVPEESGFGVANLPYGVFSGPSRGDGPRVGVRIGDRVLDLAGALGDDVFAAPSLNPFMARGRPAWRETRARIRELLTEPAHRPAVEPHLVPLAEAALHLPVEVADYVDYYASIEHATNVGRIFRPDQEPLKRNWRHLPVAYHGRAGTVVSSGTPVVRPCGLRIPPGEEEPAYGPSLRLDIEAEVGFVVGAGSRLGERVGIEAFSDHVFGVTLVNDWSARDIQTFESVPLGPYLGKSFATSVSPWITPLEALEPARVPGRPQHPEPVAYLQRPAPWGLDLTLQVELGGDVVATPHYAGMYWTPDQMLAHMTVGGAALRTGDLYASGTVSGEIRDERGSLLEISWNGAEPIKLPDGATRAFLEDGDTVTLSATAPGPAGEPVSLGDVTGTVHPAA